mgnify:CR=1 FL=1
MGQLRCLGIAAAAWLGLIVPAAALSYSTVEIDDGKCRPNCASAIVATGSINGREVEDLTWFMRHSGKNKRLAKLFIIHSGGGNAYGGLSLGMYLRQAGVTVMVAQTNGEPITRTGGLGRGLCGSACVFVLAGGAKRVVPQGSVVAVHGARPVQTEVHDRMAGTVTSIKVDRDQIATAFASYYQKMGINPGLAKLAESIPHSEFRVLSPQELSKFRLATTRM